jgi:Zn-finger nucleic acid-binding protein
VGDVAIDVCRDGCGGIWFDHGELKKLKTRRALTIAELDELTFTPAVSVDLKPRRHCPKCANSVLMRHFSSPTRAVTVDECPTCAGVWLDNGELQRIQSEYASGASERGLSALLETTAIDERMKEMSSQIEEDLPFENSRSRIVSALVVVSYLLAGFGVGPGRLPLLLDLAFRFGSKSYVTFSPSAVLGFCVLPILCIWFPEPLGNLVGGRITKRSPRLFVWALGWVVLLLPVVIVTILWAEGVTSSPFTD